jgi:hypothetical protein
MIYFARRICPVTVLGLRIRPILWQVGLRDPVLTRDHLADLYPEAGVILRKLERETPGSFQKEWSTVCDVSFVTVIVNGTSSKSPSPPEQLWQTRANGNSGIAATNAVPLLRAVQL